jgi:2-dehydro-3-deoxyphosphooctonate aldolase (KDO 8-P synthase)
MSESNVIKIGDVLVGGGNPLAFILGPCQLESRDHAMFMAEKNI